MRDHLDNFIQQNRNDFDKYDTPPALWKGINHTLTQRRIIPHWLKYAVAAMVIFTIGFGIGHWSNNEIPIISRSYAPDQAKIIESEYYYQTKINEQMQVLQPYFEEEPRLRFDIESDFKELDIYCNELKADLKDNINNEFVIEALIKSYKTKLDILEALHHQLKQECHETHEVIL